MLLKYRVELKNAIDYKWKLQNQDKNKVKQAIIQIQTDINQINQEKVLKGIQKKSDLKVNTTSI